MTPKQRRDSLFRHSRPEVRDFVLLDGDQYHKDVKLLWVAHSISPFHEVPPDISQEEFAKMIENADRTGNLFIIEDDNKQYDGVGPIAMGYFIHDDWKYEPHINFFPWATKRNILRGAVAGLQLYRYKRSVGCIQVYALEQAKNLFDHVCKYGVLHYVGKVKSGDKRGDQYIYSVRGKKT